MKSLSDIADSYDNWAIQNENAVQEIVFYIDFFDVQLQERQRERAARLLAEAEAFRARAVEIRANRFSQALPLID